MNGKNIRNNRFVKRISRTAAVLVASTLLLGVALGATVTVNDESSLTSALSAAVSGDTVIFQAGVASITLNTADVSVPAGVVLDLNSGVLQLGSGVLHVYGSIANGAINVVGGTLLKESGGSITASISVTGTGSVRGAQVLSLENLDTTSGETIYSIVYDGETGTDTSSYVQKAATATVYTEMAKTDYKNLKVVKTVTTNVGNVFRLGTKNTSTLSLAYTISYSGLTGASLSSLNPSSYTASDAATLLVNPTRDGYTFDGWTCVMLGITTPTTSMVIPEGTTGALTFVANWTEDATTTGKTGSGGTTSGTSSTTTDTTTTTEDAETQQAAAAAADSTSTSSRRVKTASSSTKVTFTSEVNTALPTIADVEGNSFPWGWLFGGAAGIAILIYIAALISRRIRERK